MSELVNKASDRLSDSGNPGDKYPEKNRKPKLLDKKGFNKKAKVINK